MKSHLILAVLCFFSASFAFADDIRIVDQTGSTALIEIEGDVAETLYHLIQSGRTSGSSAGPANVKGENVSCEKSGKHYTCSMIGLRDGKLVPLTRDFDPKPGVIGSH